jgi:hypothetical protein
MGDQEKDLFTYGDGTLMQLREQAWEIDGPEFGTRVVSGHDAATPLALPVVEAEAGAEPPSTAAAEDIARLEQKIDLLMTAVAALQRRLDSIDSTIARARSR